LAGLVIFAAAALWYNTPRLASGAFNWAESGNTAAALAESRGFSDPFLGGTGATAWVPPLFVWIEAGAFLLAGVKTAAAAKLLLVLAVAGLAAAHALLIAAVPARACWMRRMTSAVFLGVAVTMPANSFAVLSESWLVTLLSIALLWSAQEHLRAPRRGVTASLALTAVLAPLTNAGLALATAVVLATLLVLDFRFRRSIRAPLVAILAAAAGVGAWTARNAVIFGRLIPLKSNLWFEVYLANVASDDGLPRAETVLRHMPFFSFDEFARYAALGEARYVDSFRAPALAALRAAPGHFAANVARRAISALAFCQWGDGAMLTHTVFSRADTLRLTSARQLLALSGSRGAIWTRIDASPLQVHATLAALSLDDFDGVWRDWRKNHQAYDMQYAGWRGLVTGILLAGLPSLALLGAALAGRGKLSEGAAWAALVAAAMLLPFVLVNHSLRHQEPLIALQALMIGACAQAWVDRVRAPASSRGV
jgi:hypothetical protein